MIIYLGADHRGYELKEKIKQYLLDKNYQVVDLGNSQYDAGDDYPDFAKLVGEKVSVNPDTDRGILICGSGIGMVVAVNKFRGVRAGTVITAKHAQMGRNDEDINVIGISADFVNLNVAQDIADVFLTTPFSLEERHRRRVDKIKEIDK